MGLLSKWLFVIASFYKLELGKPHNSTGSCVNVGPCVWKLPVSGYLVGYGPYQLRQAVRERVPDAVVSEDAWAETDIEHTPEQSLRPGQVVMVAMPDGWTMDRIVREGQRWSSGSLDGRV